MPSLVDLTGASMASGRDSPNLSSVVSGLHLIFTLTSVAFFTYKVYYLENELSLIRREVPFSTAKESTVIKATPPNIVQRSEEQRSGRNRRAGKRKSESSSVTDKLKAVCSTVFRFVTYLCCFKHLTETAKDNPNRELRFINCLTSLYYNKYPSSESFMLFYVDYL